MKSIFNLRMVASLGLVLAVISARQVWYRPMKRIPFASQVIFSHLSPVLQMAVWSIFPRERTARRLNVDASITLRGASMNTTILMPGAAGQRVITVDSGKNLRLEILKSPAVRRL